jgi:hypothetical protein
MLAALAGWIPAVAQTERPTLVLSAPASGAVTGPDVTVVVELTDPAPAPVVFTVLLDGVPAELEDPATGRSAMTSTVASEDRRAVLVRGVPEGSHQIQVVAVPVGAATASTTNRFSVDVRGFNLVLLLATLGVLVVFVLYRRRILGPWTDRYERGGGERSERSEPDEDA